MEKDKGGVQESKWVEVGKRGEPEKELEDFLKDIEVWKENFKKENEGIETYRLYKDIGKRDNKKENMKEFPLAPMGVLAPGSAHARPSAQSLMDTTENCWRSSLN